MAFFDDSCGEVTHAWNFNLGNATGQAVAGGDTEAVRRLTSLWECGRVRRSYGFWFIALRSDLRQYQASILARIFRIPSHKPDECLVLERSVFRPDRLGNRQGEEGCNVVSQAFGFRVDAVPDGAVDAV